MNGFTNRADRLRLRQIEYSRIAAQQQKIRDQQEQDRRDAYASLIPPVSVATPSPSVPVSLGDVITSITQFATERGYDFATMNDAETRALAQELATAVKTGGVK